MMRLKFDWNNETRWHRELGENVFYFLGLVLLFYVIGLFINIPEGNELGFSELLSILFFPVGMMFLVWWYLPFLLVCVCFYWYNRRIVMDILEDRIILMKQNGEKIREVLFKDLGMIMFYKVVGPGESYVPTHPTQPPTCPPWFYLYYLKFEPKYYEDTPFYITCFMHSDLGKVIKQFGGVPIIERRGLALCSLIGNFLKG